MIAVDFSRLLAPIKAIYSLDLQVEAPGCEEPADPTSSHYHVNVPEFHVACDILDCSTIVASAINSWLSVEEALEIGGCVPRFRYVRRVGERCPGGLVHQR